MMFNFFDTVKYLITQIGIHQNIKIQTLIVWLVWISTDEKCIFTENSCVEYLCEVVLLRFKKIIFILLWFPESILI